MGFSTPSTDERLQEVLDRLTEINNRLIDVELAQSFPPKVIEKGDIKDWLAARSGQRQRIKDRYK